MIGGSYDYAYSKVADMAHQPRGKDNSALRRAFGKHLLLVSEAMHDIERVDSGDCGPGDEDAAIKKVLGNVKAAEMAELREEAEALIEELRKHIDVNPS